MDKVLVETFEFTPNILESSSTTPGRMTVEGVGQRCDVPNQNKRIYTRALWEKLQKDPKVLSILEKRQMIGMLNHPASGETDPEKGSHIVTKFWMPENSNEVYIRAEILDTPVGKILQEYIKAGVVIGVSSRGKGEVKSQGGVDYVQENFNLVTWDFVLNPSTHNAYPKLVTENVSEFKENLKENSMTPEQKFKAIEEKATNLLNIKPQDLTESTYHLVDSATSALLIDLSKLSNDAPELKGLSESLIQEVSNSRISFRKALTEGEMPWMKKDKKEDDDDEDDEKDKKKEVVKEETKGTADTGITRTVPKEQAPPPGEGWPLDVNDAGVLNGINNGVDEFMSKSRGVVEADEDEDEEMDEDINRDEQLQEVALKLVEMETKGDQIAEAAKAFAAAYLMEVSRRSTETSALTRIVEKLQEKIHEAAETGEFTLSEGSDEELVEKYETLKEGYNELLHRHRLLASKVYAENELAKRGLDSDKNAINVIKEAIKRNPSKESIDEALLSLKSVKPLQKEVVSESVEEKEEVVTEDFVNAEETKTKKSTSDRDYSRLYESMDANIPNRVVRK
jgi:hypothetical protein